MIPIADVKKFFNYCVYYASQTNSLTFDNNEFTENDEILAFTSGLLQNKCAVISSDLFGNFSLNTLEFFWMIYACFMGWGHW